MEPQRPGKLCENRYVVADRFIGRPPPPRAILGLRSFHAPLRAPGTFPSAHSTLKASLVLTEAKVLLG